MQEPSLIDIVTPSTPCSEKEVYQIKNFLKNNHLNSNIFLEKELSIKESPDHEFPTSRAELRFEQLKQAIENPNSSIIWCARGGYGGAEILPFLYKMNQAKNKKIFIGFSDISSISNFLIEEWQWQVISAPVLMQLAFNKVEETSKQAIFNLLFGKTAELKYRVKNLSNQQNSNIIAEIVGGCISVLSGNFATKNQINWQNKILFLEDEGETGERLDRYFQQIITIMNETNKYPQAILLGNFLEANPHGTPREKNIKIAIERFAEKLTNSRLKTPLFQEISGCLGHSRNMMPLILGKEAVITNDFLMQKVY